MIYAQAKHSLHSDAITPVALPICFMGLLSYPARCSTDMSPPLVCTGWKMSPCIRGARTKSAETRWGQVSRTVKPRDDRTEKRNPRRRDEKAAERMKICIFSWIMKPCFRTKIRTMISITWSNFAKIKSPMSNLWSITMAHKAHLFWLRSIIQRTTRSYLAQRIIIRKVQRNFSTFWIQSGSPLPIHWE